MEEYKVIVRYERDGQITTETWYQYSETPKDAMEKIQTHFHNLNDGLFNGAIDAKFTMEGSD